VKLRSRLVLSAATMAIVPLLLMAAVWLTQQRLWLMAGAREQVGALARNAASELDLILSRAVEQVRQLAASSVLAEHLAEANAAYAGMGAEGVAEALRSRDQQWLAADDSSPLVQAALNNAAADQLRRFQDTVRGRYAEVFVTDRAGGLYAATNRTSDYDQSDEEWWQHVMASDSGITFLNNLHHDESAGVLSLDVAVPVRDGDGQVVGVLKVVHDALALLNSLNRLQPGQTGAGHLVNARGEVILSVASGRALECFDAEDMARFGETPHGVYVGMVGSAAGECVVGHGRLQMTDATSGVVVDGGPWHVVVTQLAREVYAPSRSTLRWAALVLVVPLVGFVLLGAYLRTKLMAPINALFWASQQVATGKLDARVQIDQDDELQQVGYQFNRMAAALQRHEERQREEIRRRTEELRQADLQARRVRESISATMCSIAAHVHKNVQSAQGALDGGLAQPESMVAVSGACGALLGSVEDLQDLCDFGAGGMDLHLTSVDLKSVLASAERVLSPLIERYGVTIQMPDLPAGGVTLTADRAKLKQILYALLSNAVKHGGRGNTVGVSVRHEDGSIVIGARDEGPGLSPERRQLIFLPVTNPTPHRRTMEERIGLSLSVTSQLVALHGGEIWVDSEAGNGSEFFVRLPIESPDRSVEAPPE